MARTGNFGRAPRSAQSLTNTVIAIAREFQDRRAQNIMDAWQKGGLFEGKKATDKLVLKFWKDKSAGVSKDDPLYDTYTNTVKQLDYTIHESKMTANYALGKASDGQMVSFYTNWAKKVPKDSEFYRVLQRDAGQYMRNAKAGSEARAAQAKELAYQKAQAGTQSHYEGAATYIMDVLRRVAQSGYAAGGIAPLISAPGSGSDFTDFDSGGVNPNDPTQQVPSDPEAMLGLLRIIDPQTDTASKVGGTGFDAGFDKMTSTFGGSDKVIYHDDDKKAITGKDIIAKLAKLDPQFKPGTPLDVAHITGLLDRQMQGLNERIARANKTGHPADAASLQKSKEYVSMLNRQVAAWPIEKSYSALRETYDDVANDPTASPQAVLKAHDAYVAGLTGLANDPTIQADDNLKARIMAEAQGKAGMPTLHESFTGLPQGAYDPTSAKDSANTEAHIKLLQDQVDSVDGQPGSPVWTLGKTVNGQFTPDPTGREIGAALPGDIDAAGAPGSGTFVTLPDPKSGGTITMRVTGTPIKAVAKGPDGQPIPVTSDLPIGFAYTLPNGGATDIQYGFKGPDGSLVISADPPYDSSLHLTPSSTGGAHFEVDLSAKVPSTPDPANPNQNTLGVNLMTAGDIAGMPGWSVQNVGKPTPQNPKGKPGDLVFNPYIAATASDDRPAGEIDPMTDFHSLTLSHLMSTPEGVTVLQNLDHNPAFKDQLTADANSYAGVQRDPATGAWVPGTGDQNKLASATNAINATAAMKDITDWVNKASQQWTRQSTQPYHGDGTNTVPGANGSAIIGGQLGRLATDLVKGTPFEAVGKVFFDGTSNLKPPPMTDGKQQFAIDMGRSVKTPDVSAAITAIGQAAKFVPGIAAAPTATQTGSKPPPQTGAQPPSATTQQGSQPPTDSYYGRGK